MNTRKEVYRMIDKERDYQNERVSEVMFSDALHSVSDWILFMEHCLTSAKKASHDLKSAKAMGYIRKVTALGVAAMEHNLTPEREDF